MAPYLGLMPSGWTDIKKSLENAKKNQFSVILVPLNHNGLPHEFDEPPISDKEYDYSFPDVVLKGPEWRASVIAVASNNIDCDSCIPEVRKYSEKVLAHEVTQAEYLLSGGFIMVRLKSGKVTNLVRTLADRCKLACVIVQVPAISAKVLHADLRSDIDAEKLKILQAEDTWDWWNNFRSIHDFNQTLKVCLELNGDEVLDPDSLLRWLGEPLDSVILPSSMFLLQKGKPLGLDPKWQSTMEMFMRAGISFIVSASPNDNNLKQYAEYINHMRLQYQTKIDPIYEDVLEIPIHPLREDLNYYTYYSFREDETKYAMYQRAIMEALLQRAPRKFFKIANVIMILGAGRGQLVRAAVCGATMAHRNVRIYVVEKNLNAIRMLKNVMNKVWKGQDIKIISEDLCKFNAPEKVDILVSDLIGSFGDNELLPEFFHYAGKFLEKDGTYIPCKTTSFINPLMSSKLHYGVRAIKRGLDLGDDKYTRNHISPESGFIVILKNVYNIDYPQPLFEFEYLNSKKTEPKDNTRFKKLKFKATLDAILHGVAGYFEAVLYKQLHLSIHPPSHTPTMLSWYPIYFPFTQPVPVKKDQTIEIHFWRCVSSYKVWYEWCLVQPVRSHVHNLDGHCWPINLS